MIELNLFFRLSSDWTEFSVLNGKISHIEHTITKGYGVVDFRKSPYSVVVINTSLIDWKSSSMSSCLEIMLRLTLECEERILEIRTKKGDLGILDLDVACNDRGANIRYAKGKKPDNTKDIIFNLDREKETSIIESSPSFPPVEEARFISTDVESHWFNWNASTFNFKIFPKVTVIVPVKNRKETIRRCLDSILREDYQNMEILVIDGKSTDGTLDIIKEYQKRYPNIICESREDKNVGDARNRGLKLATGEYITYADADDEIYSGKLRLLVSFLETHPKYFAVFGNTVPKSPDGRIHPPTSAPSIICYETLKQYNYIGVDAIMFRNEPDMKVDADAIYAEDYKLWLMMMKKYNIAYIPKNAYYWYMGQKDSVTTRLIQEGGGDCRLTSAQSDKRIREVEEYYHDGPYNEDMKIAIICSIYGQHPFGGPAVYGYNLSEMLYRGRKKFRVFYYVKPHTDYFLGEDILSPISRFNPKEFNVFYVMNGDVRFLNNASIKPIIGSNCIPNSASPTVISFFTKDKKWLEENKRLNDDDTMKARVYQGKFWLAQSKYQESEYRRFGIMSDVFFANNPINTNRFRRMEPYGSHIIWSGNYGWAKRLDWLSEIISKFPDETFNILSAHDINTPKFSNIIRSSGTVFTVANILQKGKIYVSTSITENQPLGVLEAMACELPVIAFNTTGMPEIIKDGKTGLLVELGNLKEYEEKLQSLIEDEDLRIKLGRSGRQFILDNFSYGISLDKYMKLFKMYLDWE